MVNQLDIMFMLHRFNFIERAIEVLFDDEQLYGLHLQKVDSLSKIKARRKKYNIKLKL